MTDEIVTCKDLQKFRLQLLEDLTRIMSGTVPPRLKKEWLRSSDIRKMLGISHGTLQSLRIKNILPHRKIGGLMHYKYQDILKFVGKAVKRKPQAMEKQLEQLSCFISRVASDVRLRPTHTSLYLALCHAWSTSQFTDAFHVSRRRLI